VHEAIGELSIARVALERGVAGAARARPRSTMRSGRPARRALSLRACSPSIERRFYTGRMPIRWVPDSMQRLRPVFKSGGMSVLVWAMIGIALWHFAVLVPDRFWGGIIGAFLAALLGAVLSGYFLPSPGVSPANPPGLVEALWAIPGSLAALGLSYWYGARLDRSAR
jgi:hypothetical protein